MGSENSTGSGSCASGAGNSGKVSMFVRFATFLERILHKPITKASKKKIAMSATRRDTFVWKITRTQVDEKAAELSKLFVRVNEAPVIEETKVEEPKAINTVQAVIDVADGEVQRITLRKKDDSTSLMAFNVSNAIAATSAGAVEKHEFSQLNFDDFETENQSECVAVIESIVETEEERAYYSDLYDELAAEATIELMESIVPEVFCHTKEEPSAEISTGATEVINTDEIIETEEERAYYSDLYDELAAEATIELMESIVPEVFCHTKEEPSAETVGIEKTIEIQADAEKAEVVEEDTKVSHATDFIFGFQTPRSIRRGSVTFSFSAGDADDDTDAECDNICIVSHEMDSNAVSVSPYTIL